MLLTADWLRIEADGEGVVITAVLIVTIFQTLANNHGQENLTPNYKVKQILCF